MPWRRIGDGCSSGAVEYRGATADDIGPIASLHADSWRRNYRGSFSDAFLDGDVFADRLAEWSERLTAPHPDHHTVVAVDGEVVGLVHTVLWHDPAWGALLDNLHVAHGLQRGGVGTGLMARSAAAVLARRPVTGLYLWVLEANTAAQAFYAARGGTCEGSEWSEAPGGGAVLGLRYVWRDPTALL
jgi:ribosomal protein S18 acetylase RimI-like enzyme